MNDPKLLGGLPSSNLFRSEALQNSSITKIEARQTGYHRAADSLALRSRSGSLGIADRSCDPMRGEWLPTAPRSGTAPMPAAYRSAYRQQPTLSRCSWTAVVPLDAGMRLPYSTGAKVRLGGGEVFRCRLRSRREVLSCLRPPGRGTYYPVTPRSLLPAGDAQRAGCPSGRRSLWSKRSPSSQTPLTCTLKQPRASLPVSCRIHALVLH